MRWNEMNLPLMYSNTWHRVFYFHRLYSRDMRDNRIKLKLVYFFSNSMQCQPNKSKWFLFDKQTRLHYLLLSQCLSFGQIIIYIYNIDRSNDTPRCWSSALCILQKESNEHVFFLIETFMSQCCTLCFALLLACTGPHLYVYMHK